jgi:uncharacterized protein YkwD
VLLQLKFFKGFLFGSLCIILLHIWMLGWAEWKSVVVNNWHREDVIDEGRNDLKRDNPPSTEGDPIFSESKRKLGLTRKDTSGDLFIGMSEVQLLELLGEPTRKDSSAYGYEWWIYNRSVENYIQIGVNQNVVIMFYTNAPTWSWNNIMPGMEYSDWSEIVEKKEEIAFQHALGQFTFTLTDQDLKERPLLIEQKTAVQIYVDIHAGNKVSGIRLMDLTTLLLHRPYALTYVGKLPEPPYLSTSEWANVELAYERQVFDIVNVTRYINLLVPFEWHEDVATVAKGHSQDMLDNQFFDHLSPREGQLSDRLDKGKVTYRSAGENIAWNYIDAADAHEGWMNSLGHRKNIIKAEFTHLGVGVVEKYYTQNFLSY